MTVERKAPSGLLKLAFKVPVWLYQAHLGFLFGGRIFVISHHGRKSGRRYRSGLETLWRSDGELYIFSAWGRKAAWFRNIEAGGVDALWDGRGRCDEVTFRVIGAGEAFDVLKHYEQAHIRTARRTLPRMMPGYDFSDGQRHELAESAVIVAFAPLHSD